MSQATYPKDHILPHLCYQLNCAFVYYQYQLLLITMTKKFCEKVLKINHTWNIFIVVVKIHLWDFKILVL